MGFLSSLFTAVLIAVLAFFVIYFFIPSVSQQFFGFSWQGSQDTKEMKESVARILEKADVPQSKIDEYLDKWDDAEFQEKFAEATAKGKDSVVEFLSEVGEGIDFSSLKTDDLKNTLAKGFSDLGSFTSKQLKSLQRLFKSAVDSL
jgi:predicted PurR-regulated permease PerM